MRPRVDYDRIAASYDSQPYRGKEADPDLLCFVAERAMDGLVPPRILDIGCGTGNQLLADRCELPSAQMVGLDRFLGMLRSARAKARDLQWVQADGARLPFRGGWFDYITSQFAFHHVAEKPSVIADVFRVLRPKGRFVMANICPREMRSWVVYRYFPQALQRDLEDFMPKEEIRAHMLRVGFENVEVELDRQAGTQGLQGFADSVRRRETCSQLIALPDAHYRAGIERLEADLSKTHGRGIVPTQLCLIKITGHKPVA